MMPSSTDYIKKEAYRQKLIETDRLAIHPIEQTDAAFIYTLLNTPGWLRFIGNRQINSLADAAAYIQKIADSDQIVYWKVIDKNLQIPTGIVTLLKRNFLNHPDIGFAFLPEHMGHGYAYEATSAIIQFLFQNKLCDAVMAITNMDNEKSVKLLIKLGMQYAYTTTENQKDLFVYQMNAN